MFFVLEIVDPLLVAILGILVMLIMPNYGAKMKGHLLVDDAVHRISEGAVPVKDTELLLSKWWTNMVHWNGLQDAIVDGVVLAVCGLDFCFGRLNRIRNEGGNNEVVGGWIRDEDLIELLD